MIWKTEASKLRAAKIVGFTVHVTCIWLKFVKTNSIVNTFALQLFLYAALK